LSTDAVIVVVNAEHPVCIPHLALNVAYV